MTCIGRNVPKPVEGFDETPFPDYVKNVLLSEGFDRPTPIQVIHATPPFACMRVSVRSL